MGQVGSGGVVGMSWATCRLGCFLFLLFMFSKHIIIEKNSEFDKMVTIYSENVQTHIFEKEH